MPMKITKKEYIKRWKSHQSRFVKTLYYSSITQFRVEDSKKYNNDWDYTIQVRFLNPWNPLSYILLPIILFILYMINPKGEEFFKWNDLKEFFKYE